MAKKQIFNLSEFETIYNSCNEERETTINFTGSGNEMTVYTSDNSTLTKLKKIFSSSTTKGDVKCFEAGRNPDGKVTGYIFEMSKKYISFRNSSERKMSEEAKAAFGERVKKMHAERKKQN